VKPRRTSVEQIKLSNKRRRSSEIHLPALTTTSLPNTPFASPHLVTSPTFSTTSTGQPPPTRCHVCFRAQGLTLRRNECPVCEKVMCKVCTRQCVACEQERCSKCCVEELSPSCESVCWRCVEGRTEIRFAWFVLRRWRMTMMVEVKLMGQKCCRMDTEGVIWNALYYEDPWVGAGIVACVGDGCIWEAWDYYGYICHCMRNRGAGLHCRQLGCHC